MGMGLGHSIGHCHYPHCTDHQRGKTIRVHEQAITRIPIIQGQH
ncbi:MAG: hypothetical protein VKL20_03075 [Synechocystis sp.]|nr:hypothetical protein [Synechocystis sp.]